MNISLASAILGLFFHYNAFAVNNTRDDALEFTKTRYSVS